MTVAFTLSMPNCGSWNGRWSGEGTLYCIVRNFGSSKKAEETCSKLVGKSFYYGWDDGWGASIYCVEVSNRQARQLRKKAKVSADTIGWYNLSLTTVAFLQATKLRNGKGNKQKRT